MIKKPVLDAIDKRLSHMRKLFSFVRKHPRSSLAKHAYKALKRESRSLDSMMRTALKSGDVEFPKSEKKI